MRRILLTAALLLAHATAAHAAIGFTFPTNNGTVTSLPIVISGTQAGASFVFLRIEQDPVPPSFAPPAGTGGAAVSVGAQLGALTWQTAPLYLLNGAYRLTVSSDAGFDVIDVTVNVSGNPGFLNCVTDPGGFGVQAKAIDWNAGPGVAPAVNFNFSRSSTASDPELDASPTSYGAGTPFVCAQNTGGRIPRILIFGGDPVIDLNTGFAGWSYDGSTATLSARVKTVSASLPTMPPIDINSTIAGLFALYDDDPLSPGILPQLTGTWLAANASFSFTPVIDVNGKITALQLTLDGPKNKTAFFKAFFPDSVVGQFFGPSCAAVPSPSIFPPSALVNLSTVTTVPSLGCELSVEVMFQSPVTITVATNPLPPVLTVPNSITAEATSQAGAVVTFSATATGFDGAEKVICKPASGSTFPLGTTPVSCSTMDSVGNTAAAGFDVTVVDTTPPDVTVPANITKGATSPAGATVTFTASASDIVDGAVPVDCMPASGSPFTVGTTTVLCSATDAHSNTGSGSFTVTVTPLVLSPAQITANLISQVVALGFKQSRHLLQNALRNINTGNVGAACNQLEAFIHRVRAQSGKALTADQASLLIQQANDARVALGCKRPGAHKEHDDDETEAGDRRRGGDTGDKK